MKSRLLLWFFFISIASVHAQPGEPYLFRHIDQQNGLLHNSVIAIKQDADGFVWISTRNGLQRYDGLRFANFTPAFDTLSTLGYITNIYHDERKDSWFNCGPLVRLKAGSKLVSVVEQGEVLSNPAYHFTTYTDEQKGKWILGDFGLYKKDSTSNHYRLKQEFVPGAPAKAANRLATDTVEFCTWFANGASLYCFDNRSHRVYSTRYNPSQKPLLNDTSINNVSAILATDKECIWIGTWTGFLFRYNRSTGRISKYSLHQLMKQKDGKEPNRTGSNISCLYQDETGVVWAGTLNGLLLRYDKTTDGFSIVQGRYADRTATNFTTGIYCITGDREGNLWVGGDRGIDIFNPYRQPFQSIAHTEGGTQSLPAYEITNLFQSSNGKVYVSTWGGGFSIYNKDLRFQKTVWPKGADDYLLNWCFAEQDDGTIWIGAQHGYIHIYQPQTGVLKTIRPQEMENSTIRCMLRDEEGNTWLGVHNGKIVKWEKATARFVAMKEGAGITNTAFVTHLFIDAKQQLWASTDYGLLLFDTKKRSYLNRHQLEINGRKEALSAIRGVEQLNDSTLVVATLRRGLFLFDINTKTFRPSPLPQLGNKNIYAVKRDGDKLWLSTDYELYCWLLKEGRLKRYQLGSSLLKSSFEHPWFVRLQSGYLTTASTTEAIVFNPALLAEESGVETIAHITGISIFDKEISVDSLQFLSASPQLQHNQNFIRFRFSDLSFSSVNTPAFFYRLSNVDADWRKSDANGEAAYTNLSPGKYLLEIKTSEKETAPVTRFSFRIHPPFYLTWWAISLFAICIGLIIYAMFRRRIATIRQQSQLKQRIAEAEVSALRAQMSPHFIFNCLSAIDNMIETDQKEKATTYLARFAQLMRKVLESSKKSLVQLHSDVETLNIYLQLERFRCDEKFSYTLTADPMLLQGDYKVPPLVVQPFVENAIHHGLLNRETVGGRLSVSITAINNQIVYKIEDNGVGRALASALKQPSQKEHTSYGITITEERIRMFNGGKIKEPVVITDLYHNGQAVGTVVEVFLKTD